MLGYLLLITGISTALILLVTWEWRRRARRADAETLSLVSRQHIEVYNGGELDEEQVDKAKQRYLLWMRQGDYRSIEATLIPGLHYITRVRALAELGTEEACRILERQLTRTITEDTVEQAWYWIDVAHSLRMLAREECMPLLLERIEKEDDFPLVHFFAAETVSFTSFAAALKEFPSPVGGAAVRALHRALEGLRCGISPQLVAEARLGEAIEQFWDEHQHNIHPLSVRLFCEAIRHQRRSTQFAGELSDEPFEQEAYRLQVSRVAALESDMMAYLERVKQALPERLERADSVGLSDWLQVVQELRVDAGSILVRLLRGNPALPLLEQAVLALGWSNSSQAAAFLRETAAGHLTRKPKARNWPWLKRTSKREDSSVAAAALLALRHHPANETEQLLLAGARSCDSTVRAAAIGSLGWWEPIRRQAVLMYLQDARYDGDGQVRQAARAALARLGERQSLQWFRQGLSSSNRQIVLEAIHAIASEGITLLWPELDRLVDEEEPELASCAKEALEQMQEELEREPT